MNERFVKAVNYILERKIDFSQNDIAKKLDISSGYMSELMNSYKAISKKVVTKFAKAYPQINVDWLKLGEGEMLSIPQTVNTISGDHNVGNGTGNTVNSENTVQELFNQLKAKDAIISKSQAQLDKSQEQIDRLIALLEKREER